MFIKSGLTCDLKSLKADIDDYFKDKESKKPDETYITDDIIPTKDVLVITYDYYDFYILINPTKFANNVNKKLKKLINSNNGLDFDDKPIDIALYENSLMNIDMFGNEDPDMEHFNECVFILEYFESTHNCLIFKG